MPEQEQPTSTDSPAGDGGPPKTAKQLEKEAKKAEKLAKLQAKLDKKASAAPAAGEKKEKAEVTVCATNCHRLCRLELYLQQRRAAFRVFRHSNDSCTDVQKLRLISISTPLIVIV